MKLDLRIPIACVALAASACQGGYSGGGGAMMPPVGSGSTNSVAIGSASPSAGPSVPPGDTVTYPYAQASQGLQCPQAQGFTCTLRLNVGTTTSVASPQASAKPADSGTPKTTIAASASPSAAPSSGPAITITLAALPNDAPTLPNSDPKAKPTVALVRLRLTINDTVMLQGNANATFTLPQAQAASGRAFAVALFHETTRRHRRDEKFFGSYAKSTLDKTLLRFAFTPPKVQVKKDETWLLVLYGEQCSSCTATSAPAATSAPNSGGSLNSAGSFSKPNSRPTP